MKIMLEYAISLYWYLMLRQRNPICLFFMFDEIWYPGLQSCEVSRIPHCRDNWLIDGS
jgi:hypothetical protein